MCNAKDSIGHHNSTICGSECALEEISVIIFISTILSTISLLEILETLLNICTLLYFQHLFLTYLPTLKIINTSFEIHLSLSSIQNCMLENCVGIMWRLRLHNV